MAAVVRGVATGVAARARAVTATAAVARVRVVVVMGTEVAARAEVAKVVARQEAATAMGHFGTIKPAVRQRRQRCAARVESQCNSRSAPLQTAGSWQCTALIGS